MNGWSAERRLRRVAKQVEALPDVPGNDEEKLAKLAAACFAETATDKDFQWMFDYRGAGEKARSSLIDMAEAELRGGGEVWPGSGTPLQLALEIIITPLRASTPCGPAVCRQRVDCSDAETRSIDVRKY
jgi:hypothetical protein